MKDQKNIDANVLSLYELTDEREAKLWKEAIIVFDTSAILDLYSSPKHRRQNIYADVLDKLKNRLWIPNHVQYEYLKNRERIISKPISEYYAPLKNEIDTLNVEAEKKLLNRIKEIARKTLKDDKHPHLQQKEIENFKEITSDYIKQIKSFQKELNDQINIIETEVNDIKNDDDVLKYIEKEFKTGEEYDFDKILDITKEGKHRYEFKIPPGYGDYYSKEKVGTQIFGDLIIWKQILEFSNKIEKPILFITNDIKKDNDWCYIDKQTNRIIKPREELIKEINDYSSIEFWMYNLPQFLYNANKYLQSSIENETIQVFYQVINSKNINSPFLSFECNNCSTTHRYSKADLNLSYELIETHLRNMGQEKHYQAIEDFDCNCGYYITVYFNIWEYPTGLYDHESIEIHNGKLINKPKLSETFRNSQIDDGYNSCHNCNSHSSYVDLNNRIAIGNEYDNSHLNSRYQAMNTGKCANCTEIHIQCPKCKSISLAESYSSNEIECEGGCGLVFHVKKEFDRDYAEEEIEVTLKDHRLKPCIKCGEEFIPDEFNEDYCSVCERLTQQD